MKRTPISILITLSLCVGIARSAQTQPRAQQRSADPTGTWSWTTPALAGPSPTTVAGLPATTPQSIRGLRRETTLILGVQADKLVGTIFTQLSQPRTNALSITCGKLEGDRLSFIVTRELNGKSYAQNFTGRLSGGTIKGTITFERDGKAQSREWVAHRVTNRSAEHSSDPAKPTKTGPRGGTMPQSPSTTNAPP